MANFDIKYDTTPQNRFVRPRGPQISAMRTALNAFNATSYSTSRLDGMSENDMVSACTVHNLSVGGL